MAGGGRRLAPNLKWHLLQAALYGTDVLPKGRGFAKMSVLYLSMIGIIYGWRNSLVLYVHSPPRHMSKITSWLSLGPQHLLIGVPSGMSNRGLKNVYVMLWVGTEIRTLLFHSQNSSCIFTLFHTRNFIKSVLNILYSGNYSKSRSKTSPTWARHRKHAYSSKKHTVCNHESTPSVTCKLPRR